MTIAAFLQAQNTKIQNQVNDTVFKDIIYPTVVPVDTTGGEFVSSVTFLSSEGAGKAEYVNLNADDIPKVDSTIGERVMPVYDTGLGYGFGLGELQQAQALKVDLKADRALLARRGAEEKLEDIVFAGDSARGMVGFRGITNTQAKTGTAIGAWVLNTTTAATIFNNLLNLMDLTGQNRASADTILLDRAQYLIALATFFPNSSKTALDVLKEQFSGLEVYGVSNLKSIAGSKELYIAYRRSPEVLSLELPMPHKFLPLWQAGPTRWDVPGIMRTAGLNFKRKQDIAFVKAS